MTSLGSSIRRRRRRRSRRRRWVRAPWRLGRGRRHRRSRLEDPRAPVRGIGDPAAPGAEPSGGSSKGPRPGSWGRRRGLVLLSMGLAACVGGVLGHRWATTMWFPPGEPPAQLQGVPQLSGRSLAHAQALLADSGLRLIQVDSVRHPVWPEGIVIGQGPLPGRSAQPGSGVRVAVSAGPYLGAVPDVSRLRGGEAIRVLETGGFRVVVDTLASESPEGQVLGLEPGAGSEVALPGIVRLSLSRGPPTFLMPDLTGMSMDLVRGVIDSLDLRLSGTERRYSLRHVDLVFGQVPVSGESVERGSSVDIVVGLPLTARALEALLPAPVDPLEPDTVPETGRLGSGR